MSVAMNSDRHIMRVYRDGNTLIEQKFIRTARYAAS